MKFFFSILFSLFGFTINLIAQIQSGGINIRTLELNNGPWPRITDIMQDPVGKMWLGTTNGLFEYDGKNFKSYYNEPNNPNSLKASSVETFCIDKTGDLWLASDGFGFSRFEQNTRRFTHFLNNPGDSNTVMNNVVLALLADHDGMVWIGTTKGVDRYNPLTGKFTHFYAVAGDERTPTVGQVRTIYEDKSGTVWIGTGSPFKVGDWQTGGLNRFDNNANRFYRYVNKPGDSTTLSDNRITAILEDSKNNFWVGTAGQGLHSLDRKSGRVTRYPSVSESAGPSRPPVKTYSGWDDHITFIEEDPAGNIWIGSCNGVQIFDPLKNKSRQYFPGKIDPDDIFATIPYRAEVSSEGILWVGSLNGFLYKIDMVHQQIPFYSFGTGVNSVLEESPGIYLVGTESKGLIKHNPETGSREIFVHKAGDGKSISSNVIYYTFRDKQNKIWICTAAGLNLFDPGTKKFTVYNKKNSGLSSDSINYVYEDSKGKFWVGTETGGLSLFDRNSSTTTAIYRFNSADSNGIAGNYVSSIVEDSRGRLLVGNYNGRGLNLMEKEGVFQHFLKEADITFLFRDHKNEIWVGTSRVLYKFDHLKDSVIPYLDPQTGKRISGVLGIVEDREDNLWFCIGNKFVRLDSSGTRMASFGAAYGVTPSDFIYTDGKLCSSGNIVFGHKAGYYSLFPDRLANKNINARLALTDLFLEDTTVIPAANGILEKSLDLTEKINLKYNQNFFSIGFAVHDYSDNNSEYLFRLDPYDQDWRSANDELYASYFNVEPGDYTFLVRAVSNTGVISERKLNIVITPPWWRTWWAYTIYTLLAAILISSYVAYRSRRLKKEKEILEEVVAQRTSELKQTVNNLKATQAQLVQSEKMASLGEITSGIAHEIQNPLNFVNNFSEVNEELIEEMQQYLNEGKLEAAKATASEIAANEKKVLHHGRRADAIVKNMLLHSRMGTGKKEPVNLNGITEEYLKLAWLGFKTKDNNTLIRLHTDYDPAVGKVELVAQDIGQVLLNLFNNAFYAVRRKMTDTSTPGSSPATNGDEQSQFQPSVWVSTKRLDDKVEITVADNGIGIPDQIREKIFQPFFTTKPTGQGTGLGLSISYDIIKAHGGEISVLSTIGEGSTFVISLPVAG